MFGAQLKTTVTDDGHMKKRGLNGSSAGSLVFLIDCLGVT